MCCLAYLAFTTTTTTTLLLLLLLILDVVLEGIKLEIKNQWQHLTVDSKFLRT